MICGILIAHNEDLILKHALDSLDLPYIAILDNPTAPLKSAAAGFDPIDR